MKKRLLLSILLLAAARLTAYEALLIGDLHYDNADLHPGKLSEVSRNELKRNLAAWESAIPTLLDNAGKAARGRVDLTIQLGDFVQGDYDAEELHRRAQRDILTMLREKLPAPIYLVKGNHDIRGKGAVAAFNKDIIPYLEETAKQPMAHPRAADYAIRKGRDLYLFCDSIVSSPELYDWMEKQIAAVPDLRHLFIVTHFPVIVCEDGLTWCLLLGRLDVLDQRRKMLSLLTRHNAVVLCAHTHYMQQVDYTELETPGRIRQITLFSMPIPGDEKFYQLTVTPEQYWAQKGVQSDLRSHRRPITEPFIGHISDMICTHPRAGFFFLQVPDDGSVKLECHFNGSPEASHEITLVEAPEKGDPAEK